MSAMIADDFMSLSRLRLPTIERSGIEIAKKRVELTKAIVSVCRIGTKLFLKGRISSVQLFDICW